MKAILINQTTISSFSEFIDFINQIYGLSKNHYKEVYNEALNPYSLVDSQYFERNFLLVFKNFSEHEKEWLQQHFEKRVATTYIGRLGLNNIVYHINENLENNEKIHCWNLYEKHVMEKLELRQSLVPVKETEKKIL